MYQIHPIFLSAPPTFGQYCSELQGRVALKSKKDDKDRLING